MNDCIFCKIIAGSIPSTNVYEDDHVLAFGDICPQAPVHVLLVPKTHLAGMNDINEDNAAEAAHIFAAVPKVAQLVGVAQTGYRVICNCGIDGGQTVGHLHYHLLGGVSLGEGLVPELGV